MNRLQGFLSELKRRRVVRVAVGYAAIAFATVSVASDFLPALGLPEWTVTFVAWAIVLGFPIALVLSWLFDLTPGGLRRVDAPEEAAAAGGGAGSWTRGGDGRSVGFIGLGMVIALVSVGTLSQFNVLPFAGAGAQLPSIAVLPFENVSGDSANDYFSAGMHEEVLTQLYKLGGMTVISRTSVMQYRGTTKSLREVAEELGVAAVVEASVRREGTRVRIDARLIDAGTDQQLWAERYDRELSNVLALQADIAQQIADGLQARISVRDRTQLAAARARVVDPKMYETYLQGLYHSGAGEHVAAIDSFEAALALDSEYAPAYAGIARSHYVLAFFGEEAPATAFAEMEHAAERALALDPDLADAYATLALQRLHYEWDWRDADRLFRRGLELSPNHAQVRHDYAHYLLAAGRIRESVAESMRSVELDPGNMMLMACAGWHGFTDHAYDNAVQQAMSALMMMPGSFWPEIILGWAYEHKGMHGQAIASLRSAVTNSHGSPFALASLGHALAAAGDRTPAEQLLGRLLDMSRERYVSAYDIAAVYAGLGNTDEAFTWLRRARDERSAFLINVGWDPRFEELREDPRFRELVSAMQLPDRPKPRVAPPTGPAPRNM